MTVRKKLIEVALPLEAINKASAHEKQPGIGAHPRGLHLWWARRPLAAARAVIFAQMVDDPSAHPDIFKTGKAQEKERQRLFRIIEELVLWENTANEKVLQAAPMRSGRAGGEPARRTPTIHEPRTCSIIRSCPASTTPLRVAARCLSSAAARPGKLCQRP